MQQFYWNPDNQLAFGKTYDDVLYALQAENEGEYSGQQLLVDSCSMQDFLDTCEEIWTVDAIDIKFSQLPKLAMTICKALQASASGSKDVKLATDEKGLIAEGVSYEISDKIKKAGKVSIFIQFNLSDGQNIKVLFHNNDADPDKLNPNDILVAWAWFLNKRNTNITIAVANEKGSELSLKQVAQRVMNLAEKNHKSFVRAAAKKDARVANIARMTDESKALDATLLAKSQVRDKKRVELDNKQKELDDLKKNPPAKTTAPDAQTATKNTTAQEELVRKNMIVVLKHRTADSEGNKPTFDGFHQAITELVVNNQFDSNDIADMFGLKNDEQFTQKLYQIVWGDVLPTQQPEKPATKTKTKPPKVKPVQEPKPVEPTQPVVSTAESEIESEIEKLKTLVGKPEFDNAIDTLIEKIDKAGLMAKYEPTLLELDKQNSNEIAKGVK